MTFNPDADISKGRASKRGRNTGIALGGGGLGVLAIFLISQFLGVDLSGLVGGGAQPEASDSTLEHCLTGEDANEDVECRMKGASASLEAYWAEEAPALGVNYNAPQDFALFDQAVSTGCGSASSATGPFYCPPDQTIYIDVTFYDELRSRFGASGGPLAEMYVIAHEWGHHVQNLAGVLERSQDGQTGPASSAVRVELQADCFAGAWVANASTVPDDSGVPFLQPITAAQRRDALDAAAAVGDDHIQQATQGQVNPHTFTHGTSEQRMNWFETGYEQGAGACDTFSVSPDAL
ncbi:neutral zinc metallopeptidase [Agromyces sp. Root1464]|uniref:KPN_02809 family neutral zinc metallopeptidase n=1 Tax=Agromyces sp. Root1464 TaxID=1736467 RepID=UPI0007022A51|nr:neutral zinc metallopeptidase [Agromyces sp. Root1464]KQZ09195.1 neutral zinc metallopeptidase [Agromyces sp. Root1464]